MFTQQILMHINYSDIFVIDKAFIRNIHTFYFIYMRFSLLTYVLLYLHMLYVIFYILTFVKMTMVL